MDRWFYPLEVHRLATDFGLPCLFMLYLYSMPWPAVHYPWNACALPSFRKLSPFIQRTLEGDCHSWRKLFNTLNICTSRREWGKSSKMLTAHWGFLLNSRARITSCWEGSSSVRPALVLTCFLSNHCIFSCVPNAWNWVKNTVVCMANLLSSNGHI